MSSRRSQSAASTAAPILPRGGGTSLAGQCCNVAVVIDFSKYMNGVLEIDPERQIARVQPGLSPRRPPRDAASSTPRLTFGPDPATHDRCTLGGMIGNNSCGVHSMSTARPGPRPRTTSRRWRSSPTTACACAVGPTSDDELDAHHRAGGRRGEIYARPARAARPLRRARSARAIPDIPRRVSGYNLDELLPESGFNVARALVGTECDLRASCSKRPCGSSAAPPARSLARRSATATSSTPPTTSPRGARSIEPIGLEGFDDAARRRRSASRHLHPKDAAAAARRRAAGCWSSSAATSETEADAARDGADRRALQQRQPDRSTRSSSTTDTRQSRSGRCARPALGADRASSRASRTPGRAGRTRPCRPSASATTCAICAPCSTATATAARSTATSARAASTRGSTSTSTTAPGHRAATAPSWTRRPTSSSRYGGSLSGEHGDGQARAELLPQHVRRGAGAGVPRVQGDLGPGRQMNPGKVVDPYRSTRTCASAPTTTRRAARRTFASRRRRRRFARAALRCVGVGKCRRDGRRHDVPELHGHARGAALDARPRAAAVRDAAGRADPRRLAQRGGQGGARPLPRLQGLQGRLPGQRRHGDLQGRVPVALLRAAACGRAAPTRWG